MRDLAPKARKAALELAALSIETRNAALIAAANALKAQKEEIFAANRADIEAAQSQGLSAPLLKRLAFDAQKLSDVTAGLYSLAELPDPIGHTTLARELSPELNLYRVTCPIGVIGVIFESRPDALVQIASLCLKSGNAALLKGGSEAQHTNRALYEALLSGLRAAKVPTDALGLMETREDVSEMLKLDDLIDLIIPRGSNAFVRYIMDHSRIPVLGHADGVCHVYVDAECDLDMALRVAMDSKAQNVAVCNAMETLLVHQKAAAAFLPLFKKQADEKHICLLGCSRTQAVIACEAATEDDWAAEYLDYVLSIRVVDSLEEAIAHINTFGSGHTDAIVTSDMEHARRFMTLVDSAGVFHNCSTRFADGYRYGFGAEVGIATGKVHARGPMGLEGLCTYKYQLFGNGQTVADVNEGRIAFTHKTLK